jgi:hypothetical protein
MRQETTDSLDAQPTPEVLSGRRDQVEEAGFGSRLRHGINRFTVSGILQAQIKTHLTARFLAQTCIRTDYHEVRAT